MASSLLVTTPDLTPPEYKSQWKPIVEDSETKSYSYYLPYSTTSTTNNFATREQLDRWFHTLSSLEDDETAWSDAHYQGELLLRKTAWVVLDDRCTCEYGYSDTWQPISKSQALQLVVQEITAAVTACCGGCATSINSCNLNYYPQGGGVGFHADDEFLFDGRRRPTRIISLSLGAAPSNNSSNKDWGARKFLIRPQKDTPEDDVQDQYHDVQHEIMLRHGDLLTMEGMFQNHYFHSVWPGDSKAYQDHHPWTQGERINLTWRTIVQHLDGSKEECRGIKCPLSTTNNQLG
ncbi:expressed unknown protein [Seminavis robusta]|uniref:Fe2OG dioxygenase domain-containing protein n=1 Tax=Seminavis robusta TaxID=568900 RepID=A0A9N8DJB8_9STRA|nr:expressed unknown protein [Seminavis robusta]|eukprot:Sro184_g079950.1 n/a (291) ;mRNA; f:45192-46064